MILLKVKNNVMWGEVVKKKQRMEKMVRAVYFMIFLRDIRHSVQGKGFVTSD